jgi:hypothetical protein
VSHVLILVRKVEHNSGRFVRVVLLRNVTALHSRGVPGNSTVLSFTK